jgi:hypothetical protein
MARPEPSLKHLEDPHMLQHTAEAGRDPPDGEVFSNRRQKWNHGRESRPPGSADIRSGSSGCQIAAGIGRERQQRRVEPR